MAVDDGIEVHFRAGDKQSSVILHVGIKLAIFADAIFLYSVWTCCRPAVTLDARCRSLRRGRGRGRDGLDLLFGVPGRFEVLARGSDVKVVRAYSLQSPLRWCLHSDDLRRCDFSSMTLGCMLVPRQRFSCQGGTDC